MIPHLPIVGRRPELAALLTALRTAADGRGGMVLVAGAAGIGKSALLEETMRSASGFLTAVGRCPGAGETPPLGPWREAIAELPTGDGSTWTPAFADPAARPDPAATAAELCAWLTTLNQPVLLLLEDIHWADSASLELLRHLTPRLRTARVAVLATYRNDEVHRDHPLWALLPELQRAGAARMLLEGLSESAVAELAAAAGRPDLGAPVFDRSGGHPLFARELILAGLPAALPESVQQVIDAKLRRLSPEAASLMQAAAVIGKRFSYDLLFRTTQMPEDDLVLLLEEAMGLRVIRPADGPDQFAFDHALVREALLAPLIGPRRRRWHVRIAEAILSSPQPDADAVALHLSRAGDPRAPQHLLAAGDRALRLGALDQARERYERALSLMPADDPLRAEVTLKLGYAAMHPDVDRARTCWEEALRGDQRVAAWARHLLALWHYRQGGPGELERMTAVQAEQEQLLADPEYQRLEADLYGAICGYPRVAVDRALGLILAGRRDEARSLLARMRSHPAHGAARADLLQVEAYLAFVDGRMAEADHLWRGLTAARLESRQYRQALIAAFERLSGMLLWWRADRTADVDALIAEVAELEVLCQERSGFAYLADGYSILGICQYLLGDWDAAHRNLVAYVRSHPSDRRQQWRLNAAQLLLEQGDVGGARAMIEPLVQPHPDGEPRNLMDCLLQILRARISLAGGDDAVARRWLDASKGWINDGTTAPVALQVALHSAELHAEIGEMQAAGESARRTLALAEPMETRWFTLRAHRVLGAVAAAGGRQDVAQSHWQEALTIATQCRFPWEMALTQLVRGRREDLLAAQEIFARLGARSHREAAERRLAMASAQRDEPPASDVLSQREVAVLRLVADGLTDKEVGDRLFISPRTVEHHLANASGKLGVRGRAALVAKAAKLGLLE